MNTMKLLTTDTRVPLVGLAGVEKVESLTLVGATANDFASAMAGSQARRLIATFDHHAFILFNTDGADNLNYRVLAALTIDGDPPSNTTTLIASTALAFGANTGIITLDPACRWVNIQVQSAVADASAGYVLQYVVW